MESFVYEMCSMNKGIYLPSFVILSILGSLMSMSSENWFTLWVGMEISTLSFLVIMASAREGGVLSQVSAWKYLVYQGVGSLLVMISFVVLPENSPITQVVGVMGVGVKMGLVPFHGWMFHVMESSSILVLFMLSSIQKMAPLVAINSMLESWSVGIQFVLLVSAIWSSLSSVGGTSVKNMIILSSILMSAWIGFSLLFWLTGVLFFVIYTFYLLLFVVSISDYSFMGKFSSIYSPTVTMSMTKVEKVVSFGALVGIPPFGVFLMKVETVTHLINSSMAFQSFVLLLSSGIMLIGYSKLSIPLFLSKEMGKAANPTAMLIYTMLLSLPLIAIMV